MEVADYVVFVIFCLCACEFPMHVYVCGYMRLNVYPFTRSKWGSWVTGVVCGLQVDAVFVGLYVTYSHKSVSTCLRSSCGIQTCGCVWSAVVNVDFPATVLANLRCSRATLTVFGNWPLGRKRRRKGSCSSGTGQVFFYFLRAASNMIIVDTPTIHYISNMINIVGFIYLFWVCFFLLLLVDQVNHGRHCQLTNHWGLRYKWRQNSCFYSETNYKQLHLWCCMKAIGWIQEHWTQSMTLFSECSHWAVLKTMCNFPSTSW